MIRRHSGVIAEVTSKDFGSYDYDKIPLPASDGTKHL